MCHFSSQFSLEYLSLLWTHREVTRAWIQVEVNCSLLGKWTSWPEVVLCTCNNRKIF